jgi:hypothetical protein
MGKAQGRAEVQSRARLASGSAVVVDNFAHRQQCKTCPEAPKQALPPAAGGPAAGAAAAMKLESQPPVAEETPENNVRGLENLIKHLKESAAPATKDVALADLQKQLQWAKSKVLQARPLPVRLQAAVTRQGAAAAAAVTAAEAAEDQSRLIYLAKQRAVEEARSKKQAADQEVGEGQALLGKPQLEAGAVAAITVCMALLKQHGMSKEQLASFDTALLIAFCSKLSRPGQRGLTL